MYNLWLALFMTVAENQFGASLMLNHVVMTIRSKFSK